MLFLKAFAVGILVCFSTALNCLGQKVELKGSKIVVDGNFYATIENFPNPSNTDFNLKHKKILAYYVLKNQKNEVLASAQPIYDTISLQTNYWVSFQFGQFLTYKAGNLFRKQFAEDLVKFDVIRKGKINRNGLRKLYRNYNQSVQSFYPYSYGCGTGRQAIIYNVDCETRKLAYRDDAYGYFEISAMQNDSTIGAVKYFDLDRNLIGVAHFYTVSGTFQADYGKPGKTYRKLRYKFLEASGQELPIDLEITDETFDDYFRIGGTHYVPINCTIHKKAAVQINKIGVNLNYQFFL